jgi:DNA integrity scanning protein DisA with diadenylate cyclase activity
MKKDLCSKHSLKEIEKVLIRAGIEIARKGEGALFVISDKINYKRMIKQKISSFSIFDCDARKLLVSIASIDGAVIINHRGVVIDYGVKLGSKKVLKGFGTRHAAAYSSSFAKRTVSILVSQEERKIKVFSRGKIVAQIDALEKEVEKKVDDVHDLLESVGVGALSALGVSAIAPGLGIAIVPGIMLFGVPYYIFKKFNEKR